MKCEVCNKDYEGRGKVCNACRMRKSREKDVKQVEQPKVLSDIADLQLKKEVKQKQELETFGKGQNGQDMLYCEVCLFHVMRYCKNWHDCKHYLKDYDITGVRYL